MEGITILSEQITRGCPIGLFVALCVLCICICGLVVLASLTVWGDESTPLVFKILISVLIFAMMFGLVIGLIELSTEMQLYTKYQITIDDTVGFNEFHSQYGIINQDGQIFTVKLKEVLS